MQWFQSAFENQSPGPTLFAIVVGLAVALVLLFWIFRKIAGTGSQGGRTKRAPRLAVVDATRIDDKRRLVLVRRDACEHLVMIGGGSDVLIESHIEAAEPRFEENRHETREPQPESVAGASAATGFSIANDAVDSYETEEREGIPEHHSQFAPEDDKGIVAPPDSRDLESAAPAETWPEESVQDEVPEYSSVTSKPSPDEPAINVPSLEPAREEPAIDETLTVADQSVGESRMTGEPATEPNIPDTSRDMPAPSLENAIDEELKLSRQDQTGQHEKDSKAPEPSKKEEDSKVRPRLSRNNDVEDEMQRLLDELSGS